MINKSAKLMNSMQGIIFVTQTITVMITVLKLYLIVTFCVHILFEDLNEETDDSRNKNCLVFGN